MNCSAQGGAENSRASIENLDYTIPVICNVLGAGRTTVNDLIAKEKLRAINAGARTLILADSIHSYPNSLAKAA